MKYRSRASGQGACLNLKGMSRTITIQGIKVAGITDAEKPKLWHKNNKDNGP